MSNPYYTYSGAFLPGILARAEAETTEFQAVQAGFAILAIQGTDSGVADAYAVTTQGGVQNIYTDGDIVEFKAANSNTGAAATLAVDGGSTAPLTDFQGQTLAGGAIKANTWVRCMYNTTFSAWTLIAPTSQVITSNTISAAAPTHLVGLTASGGVSLACAPIDATYAIDQSIAPTWTGVHTFSASVLFNHSISLLAGVSATGPDLIYAAILQGSSNTGKSFGLEVAAGTNNSDQCALFTNASGGSTFAKIDGAGSLTVGSPTGGGQGIGTVNATGLFINGTAVLTTPVSGATAANKVTLSTSTGTATTYMRSDAGLALDQTITPIWTGQHTFGTSNGGGPGITINGTKNAASFVLTANGTANTASAYMAQIISGQGAGFSNGLFIQAATNSSDFGLLVNNAANTLNYLAVQGNGEIQVQEPPASSALLGGCHQVGYLEIPLHSTGTPGMTDRGKFIDSAINVTLPANGSVAYPVGTTMMIYNDSSSAITVAVTTDTLTWIPNNTNGSRTLAAHSLCTVYKKSSTVWLIWGFGLT